MAAGLVDRPLTMEEIADMIEANQPKPVRGPYKTQVAQISN
jgi:hypothetical protein